MNIHILPKFIITLFLTVCVLLVGGLLSVQAASAGAAGQGIGDGLQEQAIKYREAGLESQRVGNLAEAMSLYQKAIAIYPGYAAPYNDIGVVYEAMGLPERAEESYLSAIKLDPEYLSTYTNLAFFYEGKRQLEKAAFYWAKRVESGSADDPWTQKAKARLKDIRMALSNHPNFDLREEDVLDLAQDIKTRKVDYNKDDKTLSREHFEKAKRSFNRDDLATAIKEALDAQYLDQDNREIEEFIEKAESRALTR